MNDITCFVGIKQKEIPNDIKDMFAPLVPYIIDFNIQIQCDGQRGGWIKFLVPPNLIIYDIQLLQSFFKNVSFELNRNTPIDSIGVLVPSIYSKVQSHTITCELK